jgi:hypothetical protein
VAGWLTGVHAHRLLAPLLLFAGLATAVTLPIVRVAR